jgi:hypothetical protein
MTLFVNPAALRDLAGGGGPLLLAHSGVDRAPDLALPGLGLWLAAPDGEDDARLHRPGEDASLATLPLPAPPAGLLAVVAPDASAAAPLLAALDGPPLIEARDAASALPALARIAVASLAAERAAAGELHEAVATLRQEAEDTRVAMLAALQGDGHRIPPPPPVLALEALPSSAGHAAVLEDGRESLGQVLGASLEGIAALALHLGEEVSVEARLRIRLYGAESGRVHGSWVVPGAALGTPGWLHLDLPTPIGPVRETACLDLRADVPEGGRIALALEDRHAPPDRAAVQGGTPGERALAVRLWTAPFGRRFSVAPHWDWEEIEQTLAPPGVPLGVKVQLPAQVWNAALLPEGRVEIVALGAEPPRLVASMGGGERCLLVLPAVPVGGLDLLQAEVFTAMGDAGLLEAALWLQPAGAAIRSEADLSLSAPDARWSGWRRSAPGGAPLRLSLTLPPGVAPMLAAVLVMRNLGAEPEDLLRVEWSELSGARLREPVKFAEADGAGPFQRGRRPAAASLPRLPAGEIPKVAQIRLQEHYETEDGGYRHLDILVIGMQAAGFTWPRLRFKLAVGGDNPVLEFRSRPDWPPMFEAWPGRQVDEHGALLLLTLPDIARAFPARLRSERDRWMLLALIRLMPTAVATAAREVVSDPQEYEYWVDLAKRVVASLPRDTG